MEDGMKFDEVELNFILEALDAYKALARTRHADAQMADHYVIAMEEIKDRILEHLDS